MVDGRSYCALVFLVESVEALKGDRLPYNECQLFEFVYLQLVNLADTKVYDSTPFFRFTIVDLYGRISRNPERHSLPNSRYQLFEFAYFQLVNLARIQRYTIALNFFNSTIRCNKYFKTRIPKWVILRFQE